MTDGGCLTHSRESTQTHQPPSLDIIYLFKVYRTYFSTKLDLLVSFLLEMDIFVDFDISFVLSVHIVS